MGSLDMDSKLTESPSHLENHSSSYYRSHPGHMSNSNYVSNHLSASRVSYDHHPTTSVYANNVTKMVYSQPYVTSERVINQSSRVYTQPGQTYSRPARVSYKHGNPTETVRTYERPTQRYYSNMDNVTRYIGGSRLSTHNSHIPEHHEEVIEHDTHRVVTEEDHRKIDEVNVESKKPKGQKRHNVPAPKGDQKEKPGCCSRVL